MKTDKPDNISLASHEKGIGDTVLTRRGFLQFSVGGITLATVALSVGGCGSSGRSSAGEENNRSGVEVLLAWPERQPSRDIPPYALSIILELFPKASPNDSRKKLSQTVNRPDGNAAITQTVYFDKQLEPNTYVLTGEARTEANGGGAPVARAQTEFEVRDSTLSRPALTLASTIAKIEILGQPVGLLVGEQLALIGHALDADGQVILLPDDVLRWQQVSGVDSVAMTEEAVITGLAKGAARIRLIEPSINQLAEVEVTVRAVTDGLAVSPWPKFRGNLLCNGRSNNGGPTSGIKRWQFPTRRIMSNSPAIGTDGTIYVSSWERIYALDGSTGVMKWEFNPQSFMTACPAIGSDGTVYIGATNGKLFALHGASGLKKWEFFTDGESNNLTSPTIGADGTVYIASDFKIQAVDGTTAVRKWEFHTNDETPSSPAIGIDGTVYIGFLDKVCALNGRTGIKKWEFLTGNEVNSSPAIGSDGTVYIGSADRKVYALDGTTGIKKWEFLTGGAVSSSPAIGADGTIYVGSQDNIFYAIA